MSGLYSPHNFLGIYAYPTHSLSLSCSLNPSFFHYLFWLGVFCDSLISLLSPLQSLSVQACLYSPSFAEPFTSPAHFFMQVFEHTQHVQGSTHVLGSYPHIYLIFPPHSSSLSKEKHWYFCKAAYQAKTSSKSQLRFYLIGFHQAIHTYHTAYAASRAR